MFQVRHYESCSMLHKNDAFIIRSESNSIDGYLLSTTLRSHSDDFSFQLSDSVSVNAKSFTQRLRAGIDFTPAFVLESEPVSLYFTLLEEYLQFCEFFSIESDAELIERFNAETTLVKANA
ncbi:hypothetical protein [Vibrio cionasavignyae]|uniref:hypothetical protein n=1 Tax=Vibrio cionasavignyae TaxID=2910252 RepID=UPI003D12113E